MSLFLKKLIVLCYISKKRQVCVKSFTILEERGVGLMDLSLDWGRQGHFIPQYKCCLQNYPCPQGWMQHLWHTDEAGWRMTTVTAAHGERSQPSGFRQPQSEQVDVNSYFLWQKISLSYTDPDCSSYYDMRGFPLIWKPSNHGRAEHLAQTLRLTLMDLLRSTLWGNKKETLPQIQTLKKGSLLFFLAVCWREKCNISFGSSRHGHTVNVCSWDWSFCWIPGSENKETDVRSEGLTENDVRSQPSTTKSPLLMLPDGHGIEGIKQ